MNVVDSSGWIEYFVDGKNADFFEPVILAAGQLLVPVICMYEVFKRLSQERGEDEALRAIGFMSAGKEVNLDRDIAIFAAQISLEHKLAMADSILYATAQARHAMLWTQDEHFKGLPGVEYVEKKA